MPTRNPSPSSSPRTLKQTLIRYLPHVLPSLVLLLVVLYLYDQQAERIDRQAFWVQSNTSVQVQQAGSVLQGRIALLEQRIALLPSRCISSLPAAPFVPAFAPVVRTGRVTSATGATSVQEGAACTVRVWSASSGPLNCKIHVRCGDSTLYGPGSYAVCGMDGAMPDVAIDEDPSGAATANDRGDPRLEMRLMAGRVVVSDGPPPEKALRVEIVLE